MREYRRMDELPPLEWFKARVFKVTDDGCWLWRGPVRREPNGELRATSITYKGQSEIATRAFYRRVKGEFDPTLVLDHLCRVPRCVNPDHLEPVTQAVNAQRGLRGMTTECPKGHAYDETNTYWATRPDGRKFRVCRSCRDARYAAWKQRKAAA